MEGFKNLRRDKRVSKEEKQELVKEDENNLMY